MSERPSSRTAQVQLGSYELAFELSTGPLGARWAATATSGGEQGRVVVVRRVALRGDDGLAWTLCEAASAAGVLRDPRVCATLDVAVGDDEIGLVSEYVDGEPLRALLGIAMLTRQPLPRKVALRIVADLLEAIDVAAALWARTNGSPGAVFGCVTPDMALVASFGEALLIDVGLGGMAAELGGRSREFDFVAYTAPERLKPSGPADPRAAVFSATVMLYEMLTNRPLFSASARHSTARMRIEGGVAVPEAHALAARVALDVRSLPVPRLDTLRKIEPVSRRVADVVARGLARDPERRWSTPTEMGAEIAALGADEVDERSEVAVALEEIMRQSIVRRRQELRRMLRGRRSSRPPDSGRETLKPEIGQRRR